METANRRRSLRERNAILSRLDSVVPGFFTKDRSMNKCQISRTWRPVFRPNGTTLCQPRATPWEIFHALISSPNGAALIFAVTSLNLFRSAPLGLFVPDIP